MYDKTCLIKFSLTGQMLKLTGKCLMIGHTRLHCLGASVVGITVSLKE